MFLFFHDDSSFVFASVRVAMTGKQELVAANGGQMNKLGEQYLQEDAFQSQPEEVVSSHTYT